MAPMIRNHVNNSTLIFALAQMMKRPATSLHSCVVYCSLSIGYSYRSSGAQRRARSEVGEIGDVAWEMQSMCVAVEMAAVLAFTGVPACLSNAWKSETIGLDIHDTSCWKEGHTLSTHRDYSKKPRVL